MVSQKVIVNNPSGLHLRPAGILCKVAIKFKSLITFTFSGGIELVCEGADEKEALEALVKAIEGGLGE